MRILNFFSAIVAFALCLGAAQSAEASHFRYGTIQWRLPDPVGMPRTVEFTVDAAWRSDFIGNETLNFGDATTGALNFTTGTNIGSGVDQAGETYAVRRVVLTHTYAADGQFTAFFASCCRVGSLSGGSANGNYRVEARVAVGGGNTGGPTTGALPIIQMQRGQVENFSFNMFDPDGDTITCRFALAAETGITDPIPTVGGNDPVITGTTGNSCDFQWNLAGAVAADDGDKYVMHFIMESVHAGQTSKTAVDLIVEIIGPSVAVPSCASDASLTILPGASGSHTMTLTGTGTLTVGVVGLPPGATLSPAAGSTVASGASVTFNWSPTLMQTGSQTVLVNVTNSANITRSCVVDVQVPICADFGTACTVGVGQCAVTNVRVCTGIGVSTCDAVAGMPVAELCDGLDNDCNGTNDNGFNVGASCNGTTGVCAAATGVLQCNGLAGTICSVDPGGSMPAVTAEICDGLDNNCNGTIDDGFNIGAACMGTLGVCAATVGAIECDGPGATICSVDPDGSTPAVTAETCDAADNNCNGVIDDGFNVGGSCMGTTGVCALATGAIECTLMGTAMCSVNPGGSMSAVTVETCDGADNNCNGSSDEGFNVGSSCMGTTGVCAQATGAVECNGTGGAMCSVNPGGSMSAATAETCDGADNNCNGSSDEGFNVGTSCMGTTGICALATGAVECDGMGAAMCSVDPGGSTSATLPEDCDGADNNCNGSTDEGILCECLADADCADGNSCTVNTCESDACVDTSVPAGDLGECTMGAVCSGDPTNACVTCADTDPTNTDSGCAMETPHCRVVAMGATCEICADLGPGTDVGCETATPNCVVGDSGASECVSCISDSDCDDGNECTTEVCSAGACTNPSLTEFSPCSGGVCTAAAMCTAVTVVIEGPPDGDVLANATPTISGTGTPGATIDVIIDGTSVGTTIVDALGQWTLSLTTPLDDGPHAVIAETTVGGMDAMDNSGFSVDTMTVVAIVDPADGSTTLDSSPLLRGTGEPGAEVVVSIDGVEVGRVTVAVDGTWFIGNIDALLNGPHTMTAVATDLVGNTATATSAFTVDSDTAVDINGPASGALLNNNMPTITGTAVPGAQVVISIEVGGTPTTLGTVTADASGNWTLPLTSPLADGPYVVTALATDPIGNMASDSSVFSIDTVTLVTVDDIDPGTGVISGTGEPGAEIRITVDGNEVGVVTVGSDGTWSFDGDSLGVGTHVVDVTATDPAGNTATDTSSITVPMMDGGVGPDSGTSGTFGGVSGGALCSTGAPAGEGWPAALGLLLVGAALAHRRRR